MEVWKDVVGFEEYFQVSNLGNVYSKRRSKLLKKTKSKNGYLTISTRIKGECYCFYVHRLVAKSFLINEFDKPCINHIDGDKSNNVLSNLEWVTHLENSKHAIENHLFTPRVASVNRELTSDEVLEIRTRYVNGCRVNGGRALAREFNLSHSSIQSLINGETYIL